MRPGFLMLPFIAFAINAKAQLGVGITTPDASAQLHVESTSKGVLVPRVASTANVTNPAKGLLVYQTGGTEGFYYNSGTAASPNWVQVLAGNYVQLAPSAQQITNSTNSLINLKLVGTTGLGIAGTKALASLSASGTYVDGSTHDKERFRVDNDGSILAVSDYNGGATVTGVPMEGSGTRFMWYGQKAAFRAGYINGTQWDDANIGLYSTALGENVRALGNNAIAFGKNTVAANVGTISMGEGCTATGANSVAIGYGSSTSTIAGSPRQGSFVFADRSVPLTYSFGGNSPDIESQFHPTVNHSFNVRATGGSYFYTNTALTTAFIVKSTDASLVCTNNSFKLNTDGSTTIASNSASSAGVSLAAGGGSWASLSDVNMKENFANVDGEELLERLRNVPITSWNYKTQDSKIRHIGPMAQDFAAAFNVGEDNRHIATIDPDGVALAGVQALDNRTNNQQLRIEQLQKENKELKERLERLEKLLTEGK
jgi:trimeric autotransporter adhesin